MQAFSRHVRKDELTLSAGSIHGTGGRLVAADPTSIYFATSKTVMNMKVGSRPSLLSFSHFLL